MILVRMSPRLDIRMAPKNQEAILVLSLTWDAGEGDRCCLAGI